MAQRQYATPVLLRGAEELPLERIPLEERSFDEDWLQGLLFRHPLLLPIDELESVFSGCVALCREMETGVGPVDLVLANENGFIVLVETKLWRNQEARRTVVAQIIDYTKELAKWTYSEFNEQVLKARRGQGAHPAGLAELVGEADPNFDEKEFIDRISRNLKVGRFLLLIVGDGIQQNVEELADFLQLTPQLRFTLALVELGLFRTKNDSNDELLVQPRVLARTQEITRAVVEIIEPRATETVRVTLPPEPPSKETRQPITEEQFFEELGRISSEAVALARWALQEAEDEGLDVRWSAGGPLIRYVDDTSGEYFTLAQLGRYGTLESLWSLPYRSRRLGLPDTIWEPYFAKLEELIPGSEISVTVNPSGEQQTELIFPAPGKPRAKPPLALMNGSREEWMEAMKALVDRIRQHFAVTH